MSENPEPSKGSTPNVEGAEKVNKPPVKKGWSNPALRMMGIPKISLPSRNWMIFWTLLASVGGGVAYDRYQQKQIRKKWMEKFEPLGEEAYRTDRIPRKLSVFIAPPPNDYLDSSMVYFRKYVKPLLNASAIDFDVFTENRQGDIRAAVAERIRELRIETNENAKKAQEEAKQEQYDASWTKFFKKDVPNFFTLKFQSNSKEDEALVSSNDLYSPKDVLGLYYLKEPIDAKRDDELNPMEAGGVICIGRGAYKEYMTGVHEGLLGPLEAPEEVRTITEVDPQVTENEPETAHNDNESKAVVELPVLPTDDLPADSVDKQDAVPETPSETAENTPNAEEGDNEKPVPKPFITPDEYPNATYAPEFQNVSLIMNKKNVPVIFEQPVYVFPLPIVSGFLNTHRKLYRFFTKRNVADDYGCRTSVVVQNVSRPFVYKDQFMAKEEELEWPKKWVATGKEKNSEWVQELVTDDRVTTRMKVFDVSLAAKSTDKPIDKPTNE
ncbi:DEHA2C17226p [Debaryomyces hansenii CBS767]|uniref:Mitochondrial import inner membrane translocase subunit TIM54 n=1 Tax=Debaryomyces hansenii (strain ATCC 36239 / CBS 767 / BCRC 21394 / JCM 1990 / NBRC 0083 / IGC 2968) TaxID=284592 RepID=TIM54_DEBHA|nr:DEHA2C17226p [Debaryomyces hansenii CBS767]Q6BTN1.2 RecName: Full=Mitochondrial import inner membrane translocase subunit TIM54 [Debaryomyces hansenii CBS767]CAG86520.2 DEHA2C17226p [Debaryomyces hansenii CBS767]|eukprot:XP_458438.2 DEHA2C17226p [Debaryomyces hansenii CBS767]